MCSTKCVKIASLEYRPIGSEASFASGCVWRAPMASGVFARLGTSANNDRARKFVVRFSLFYIRLFVSFSRPL